MEIAKTVWDVGFTCWERKRKHWAYVRSLGDNLSALRRKRDDLGGVEEDVIRRVEKAEGEHWVRTSEAAGWLQKAQALMEEADVALRRGEMEMKRSCLCGLCYMNCRTRYKESKFAEAKKAELEEQLIRGHGLEVVAYEPADLILARCLDALQGKMGELRSVFEDVKQLVEEAERRNLMRTAEVGSWLERVGHLIEEVGRILVKGEQEMQKTRLQVGDHDSSQSCFELSKLSEEKTAAILEELGKGQIYSAAGKVSSVANLLVNPFLKVFVDTAFGKDESGESRVKLPEWSPVTGPGQGGSQQQETLGRQGATTEGAR